MNIHERFQAQMLLILFMCFLLIAWMLINIGTASSQDTPLTGKTIIDHEAYTAVYTEHHVGVSATVIESDCVKCLKRFSLDSCWEVGLCEDVQLD